MTETIKINFKKRYEFVIDPNSYFVKKEKLNKSETLKVHYSGNQTENLDTIYPRRLYKRRNGEIQKRCGKICKLFI